MNETATRETAVTFAGFAAYFANAASFISPGAWEVIPFLFEDCDQGNGFDSVTHQYTVPQSGLYLLGFSFRLDTLGGPAPTMAAASFFRNGHELGCGTAGSGAPVARNVSCNLTVLAPLAANDAIDVRVLLLTNSAYVQDTDAAFWGYRVN